MKNVFVFLVSLVLIGLLTHEYAYSQGPKGYVNVAGKVKTGKSAVPNAAVNIYQNNTKIKSLTAGPDGKFDVRLELDQEYVIEASGSGLVAKKVLFDTHTPEKDIIFKYPFTIELFENFPGLDFSALNKPVTKIKYSEDAGDFDFDVEYTEGMRKEIDKITAQIEGLKKQSYQQLITKADELFKAGQYQEAIDYYEKAIDADPYSDYPDNKIMECEKLMGQKMNADANYQKFIASADQSFASKNYSVAKTDYQKASTLKPNEAYPKQKIAEIDKLLADEKASQEEKLKDEKYNAAIAKADGALAQKNYALAKTGYNEALGIKPNEQYPKDKLAEISNVEKELADNKAKEDQYKAAIAKADVAFAGKNYTQAKASYNEALGYKPNESHPKTRLAEIEQLEKASADAKALEESYKAAIAKADAALTSQQYDQAKSGYNEALKIKPAEQYPKTKIAEIDKILADKAAKDKADADAKAKEEAYKNAVAKGDAALTSKDYPTARNAYNEALQLKPTEQYPKTKLQEITALEKAEADAKTKDENYAKAIKAGDDAFGLKNYTLAKSSYTQALTFKPDEKYPKDKIAEINTLEKAASDAKALEDAYKAAITKADAAFNGKKWADAKTAYNEALTLKPNETYPKTKLQEIATAEKADLDAKAREDAYKAAITKADAALGSEQYDQAKSAYNEALTVKPAEQYPKTKIAEIDKLLADKAAKDKADAEAKAKEEAYKNAITKADAAFNGKKWADAKTAYNEALGIKPNEQYPKTKLQEIATAEKADMDAKAKEEAYKAAIAKADAAFGSQQYDQAKTAYNEALAVKPAEQYPKTKIAEIDKLLADKAAKDKADADAKAKEEAYKNAITKADAAFNGKKWAEAKTAYNEALGIKPNEQYPKTKLQEIATAEKADMDAKAKEEAYKAAIAKADAAFGSQQYDQAKTAYNEALAVKPAEQYPKTKIAEIDKLLADKVAKDKADAEEKAYKAAIAKADAAFNGKKWAEAKTAYNEALGVKPNEQYPKTKLQEIATAEKADLDAKAKEDAYKAAISKADAAFGSQKYDQAKTAYNEALAVKPAEQYPITKIAEIDKILADKAAKDKADADAKAKEEAYKSAITKADAAFNGKKWADAKTAYNEALGIKPNEQYPKTKLQEIATAEKADLDAKAKEEAYKTAIAKADAAFGSKQYDQAKSAYNEALAVKPAEQYPKTKIAEIDKLLADKAAKDKADADAKAKEDAYKAAIAKADAAFNGKNWDQAIASYNEASGMKPAETYPKDKIAEINRIKKSMADAKAKDEAYAAAIAKGDAAFGAQKYDEAKTAYVEASGIKSDESYPKTKIAEIDKIKSDLALKQKDESYKTLITKADADLAAKSYEAAKTGYKKASEIKPEENYPKQKITEIDNLLAQENKRNEEQKLKDKQYQDALAKADASFASKDYPSAIVGYKTASGIKPEETYPKNKIIECQNLIKTQNSDEQARLEAERLKQIEDAKNANKKLEEIDATNKEAVQKYLSELAQKYPEGVTEELFTDPNKKIKRVIVNKGGVANDYREVTHSWGGVYYFKNGQSVSKNVFQIETKP